MTFDLCKKLIKIGKTNLVSKNLELYHLAGRLTDEEYRELVEMIAGTEDKE